MNKTIAWGIAAFGGILLVLTLLSSSSSTETGTMQETASPTLPAEVTISFPTYPNTSVSTIRQSTSDVSRIFYSFSLEAEASISDIHTWYRNELNQNGWAITSDKNVAGYQIIQGEKDNLFTSLQVASGKTPDTAIISQQAQIRP